jgi:hypothetical protein
MQPAGLERTENYSSGLNPAADFLQSQPSCDMTGGPWTTAPSLVYIRLNPPVSKMITQISRTKPIPLPP